MSHKSEYFQDDRQPDPEDRCPTCGRSPEPAIACREFTLGAVGRPNVILLGLWSNAVLIKLEGVIESALLSKEEAKTLAERLHRYAEELP